MQILIEFIVSMIVLLLIGCTNHEFLDKECTFLGTHAIREAMRQSCTGRLRTDYT